MTTSVATMRLLQKTASQEIENLKKTRRLIVENQNKKLSKLEEELENQEDKLRMEMRDHIELQFKAYGSSENKE